MAATEGIVEHTGRILYVDPNNVHGNINGVPMTPDYTDYCISFNLVVEVSSRIKSNKVMGSNHDKKFVISFASNDVATENQASFLRGTDTGKYSYLTTYYTDISFDDIKEREIVEGLGVESVNVSFESYYTPTVNIKFVDVRGSSLFGREEAVHQNNKLTADNIYGCFFTQPYPMFRLQIKGFYGEPVTYQLACSGVKGEFNSQNGNFEMNVTFIGYSYSLLTDIPLQYIVAAPYCKYIGEEYWNAHVNTKEWELANGEKPVKLFDYIRMIKQASVDGTFKSVATEHEQREIESLTNEKGILNKILSSYHNVTSSLVSMSIGHLNGKIDTETYIHQNIYFFKRPVNGESMDVEITKTLSDSHNSFISYVNTYNNAYISHEISDDMLPNGISTPFIEGDRLKLTDFCVMVVENGQITDVSLTINGDKTKSNLKTIEFNDKLRLKDKLAEELVKWINPTYNNGLNECAYLWNCNGLLHFIKKRIEVIDKRHREIIKEVDRRSLETKKSSITVTPYIGNIVKIIMCHLETFVHMVEECSNRIYDSNRKYSQLGINPENTDLVGVMDFVPPFPMIYSNGSNSDTNGNDGSEGNVIGWCGDFSHNFEEEKLILSLQSAAQKLEDITDSSIAIASFINYPIMPLDVVNGKNAFGNVISYDISTLSGVLATRAAQIFGVLLNGAMNTSNENHKKIIETIGRMDAYNFYQHIGSKSAIKEDFLDKAKGNNTDVLYGISVCDENYDNYGQYYSTTDVNRHKFETVKEIYNAEGSYDIPSKRHPILFESNDQLCYCHYYTLSDDEIHISIPPAIIKNDDLYRVDFEYEYKKFKDENGNERSEPHFNPLISGTLYNTFENVLYGINTKSVLEYENDEDYEKVLNDNMFNIYTENDIVSEVLNTYDKLKNGSVKLNEFEKNDDFNSVLERMWCVSNSHYGYYFSGCSGILSRHYNELSKNTSEESKFKLNCLYPTMKGSDLPDGFSMVYSDWCDYTKMDNVVMYDTDENRWKCNNINLSFEDLKVQDIRIYSTSNTKPNSLFGDDFYYMQNNKIDESESDIDFHERKMRSKCLLYLHTLTYNNYTPNFIDKERNNGGIEIVPYGVLLLLGGLVWRERYLYMNKKDPIIYKEGTIEYKSASSYDENTDTNSSYTLFKSGSDGKNRLTKIKKVDNNDYTLSIHSFFDSFGATDVIIKNRLYLLFDEFVKNEWCKICSSLELRVSYGENKGGEYTATSFLKEVGFFYDNIYTEKVDVEDLIPLIGDSFFSNFFGNYRYVYVGGSTNERYHNGGLMLLIDEDKDIQKTLVDVYTRKCVVIYPAYMDITEKSCFNKSVYRQYLNSFVSTLEEICQGNTTKMANPLADQNTVVRRDLMIPIYIYLKHLWDKWLTSAQKDEFKVSNFFSNFVFIDSFYKNIFKKLIINLDTFLESYVNRSSNGSIYLLLSDIASKHHCMLLSMPDYINLGDENINVSKESLEKIFIPIPYNSMPPMERSNKFIFMFTHSLSSVSSEQNNYRCDYWDIWTFDTDENGDPTKNPGHFSEKAKKMFSSSNENSGTDQINRYGYNVPSFGVSFSSQNNHLFKSVKVNMNNPMETSASIAAMNKIAQMGSGNNHKVSFFGQDIYPVFSNYSYFCDIEMMGCAQIMPLMYFQLMNIPMWRGTYMIYKVSHDMTPGNMTTRFSGMKLSSYCLPFNTEWFIPKSDYEPEMSYSSSVGYGYDDSSFTSSSNVGGYEDTILDSTYNQTDSDTVTDHWSNPKNRFVGSISGNEYGDIKIEETHPLRKLYNCLYEEIKQLPENVENNTWNVALTHVIRDPKGSKSDHAYGCAMDLQVIVFDKNGNTSVKNNRNDKPQRELLKALDILAVNHKNEIRQVILEYKKKSDMNPSTKYFFNVLHVAIPNEKKESKNEFTIMANDGGNYTLINKPTIVNEKSVPDYNFLQNVPYDFKNTASRYYGKSGFKSLFPNYSFYDDKTLKEHFNGTSFNKTRKKGGNDGDGYTYDMLNGKETLSKLNNNPGNLKKSGVNWEGSVESEGDFIKFEDMYYGTRALMLNLDTIVSRLGDNATIPNIIKTWAPEIVRDENGKVIETNNTMQYINYICSTTGYSMTDKIPRLVDGRQIYKEIAWAIGNFEGKVYLEDKCLNKAYAMAKRYRTKNS